MIAQAPQIDTLPSSDVMRGPTRSIHQKDASSLNKLMDLLLAHDPLKKDAQGRFGDALSMAECKSKHEIFDTLLLYGAKVFLGSLRLVALERGQDEIAMSHLNARSRMELDPSGLALQKACERVPLQSLQPCKAILTFTRHNITSLNH